jgi:parallel beta-helix repeat protein
MGCDFSDNGSSVVPGPGIHHNLLVSHVQDCRITGSRMDTSPWGNGISVTQSKDITILNNELARNKLNGIYIADSYHVSAVHNLTEGNDRHGILLSKQATGCSNVNLKNNQSHYNGQKGINVTGAKEVVMTGNIIDNNGVQL